MANNESLQQQAYYQATAGTYHQRHVAADDEHGIALKLLTVFAAGQADASPSFLDVGAGTGRAMRTIKASFPGAKVQGVEPVQELREEALRIGGISDEELIAGNALELPFGDDCFDWVVETGVLHHIRHWEKAVEEMVRVARFGILISDSNNIGQGGAASRRIKKIIKRAGLWNGFVWLQTKGKMWKYSEGDGVYYSFCAFDVLPIVRQKFPAVHVMNTTGPGGADLLLSTTHVGVLAHR